MKEEEKWRKNIWGYGNEKLEAIHGKYEHFRGEWEIEEESKPPPSRKPYFDVWVSEEIFSIWQRLHNS